MQKIKAFFSLIRWYNLLLVALTQILFRYCIILPVFKNTGHELQLITADFFILVLATMLVSAAGYAINDYFDLRVDRINRPGRIIVGRLISRRSTILIHSILNFLGVVMGLYISWRIRFWPLAFIFLAVPLALWLYSLRFKRSFLTGNITVALLTAMVIPLVWLVEYRAASLSFAVSQEIMQLNFFARFYSFFAFLISLGREIVKDIEDYAGDKKIGCRSLPVISGLEYARRVALGVMGLIILMIVAYVGFMTSQGSYLIASYFLFFVSLPLILILYRTVKAQKVADFGLIQRRLKVVMLAGVLSMVFFFLYLG